MEKSGRCDEKGTSEDRNRRARADHRLRLVGEAIRGSDQRDWAACHSGISDRRPTPRRAHTSTASGNRQGPAGNVTSLEHVASTFLLELFSTKPLALWPANRNLRSTQQRLHHVGSEASVPGNRLLLFEGVRQ